MPLTWHLSSEVLAKGENIREAVYVLSNAARDSAVDQGALIREMLGVMELAMGTIRKMADLERFFVGEVEK